MQRYSANLNFLWPRHDLGDAVQLARRCGFDGVECHWPYAVAADDLRIALSDTQMPMLSINTRPGDLGAGEFGLAAVPEKRALAREYIDEAIDYAALVQCRNIHVMAGKAGSGEAEKSSFLGNLDYACTRAAGQGITVLIEPINNRDVPGYYLNTVEAAVEILQTVDRTNLKILFDFYHVQMMQGNLISRVNACFHQIGHLQIASVPGRAEPDLGEIDYAYVIRELGKMGYSGFIGAEYRPAADTVDDFGWLEKFKSIAFE